VSHTGLIVGYVFGGIFGLAIFGYIGRCMCRKYAAEKSARALKKRNKKWVHADGADPSPKRQSRQNTTDLQVKLMAKSTPNADSADLESGQQQSGQHVQQCPEFPSGAWRGYYNQYGARQSLFNFDLRFNFKRLSARQGGGTSNIGNVSGAGVDGVGSYKISGTCNRRTGRLGFSKKYILGTGDRHENKGHSVEYKGTVQGSLAAGVRGAWDVRTANYSGTGDFHIWPENTPPPFQPPPTAPPLDFVNPTAPPMPMAVAEATAAVMAIPMGVTFHSSAECVVCFGSNVDSCLRPCGHIAMCNRCAKRLLKCPICRAQIVSVEKVAVAGKI
jgi:hypothetical protein